MGGDRPARVVSNHTVEDESFEEAVSFNRGSLTQTLILKNTIDYKRHCRKSYKFIVL